MTRRLVVALSFFVLLVSLRAAHACSCPSPGPSCEAFWDTGAVFDGTVTSITAQTVQRGAGPEAYTTRENLVTFQVSTGWKGVAAGTVSVRTITEVATADTNSRWTGGTSSTHMCRRMVGWVPESVPAHASTRP